MCELQNETSFALSSTKNPPMEEPMNTDKKITTSKINLEAIKLKLTDVESGEGWSQARADAVEREYRRFLYLMKKYPDEETSPTVDIDTFWHYHILDTMKYAADCERVFGYFLHHYPYVGLRGEGDAAVRQRAGERMRELYEQTFGASEARELAREDAEPAYCAAAGHSYCSAAGRVAYCAATRKGAYRGRRRSTGFTQPCSESRQLRRKLARPRLTRATAPSEVGDFPSRPSIRGC
jgi:Glycine-rich domain-containing protein-like